MFVWSVLLGNIFFIYVNKIFELLVIDFKEDQVM